MKRRIIVMRHAKSSWKSAASTDHERPLNERGRRDAPRVGARLAEIDWIPAQALCSDSARTTETFELLGFDIPVRFVRDLYHAGVEEVCSGLRILTDDVPSILLLGHNPGWQEVVLWLSGEAVILETACAALLERTASTWNEAIAERGGWRLIDVIRPKTLDD